MYIYRGLIEITIFYSKFNKALSMLSQSWVIYAKQSLVTMILNEIIQYYIDTSTNSEGSL